MMAAAQREIGRVEAVLLGEDTFREDGTGPILTLAEHRGLILLLIVEITRVIERESLVISICGSTNGLDWAPEPLLRLPKKYYCGTYAAVLDLSDRPAIQYLRVKWDVNRWAKDGRKPVFTFHISIREAD